MKQLFFSLGFFSFGSMAFCQVGINNQNPKATLDVTAKTTDGSNAEGFIAPRLTGDQIKSGDSNYGTSQKGSLIYATAAVTSPSSKTGNITTEGYYYFDGNVWQKVGNNTDTWKYSGNAGTTAGTHFIGTTDNTDLVAKTNNTETLRITKNQKVLIGTSTLAPGANYSKLSINGRVQILDGSHGEGKVFSSDLNGVGFWAPPISVKYSTPYNLGGVIPETTIISNLSYGAHLTCSHGQYSPGTTNASWNVDIGSSTASVLGSNPIVIVSNTLSNNGSTFTVTNNHSNEVTVEVGGITHTFKIVQNVPFVQLRYSNNNASGFTTITGLNPLHIPWGVN
jgi:hypothetical protein